MRERIVSSIKGKRRDGWEGLGSPTVPACLSDQDVEVLAARSWKRRGGGRLGEDAYSAARRPGIPGESGH